ncbi:unnamed protein product [Eruca vesicaria subsp. sativa]|uniref:Uncharacterized protein n=1 Tax=Eruca vesicaria subsp. sativa TaxID=29727 RepID=A0ABC8LNY5_ERUVS|nr:unnamed protein product [Eruca vesicaria subsp. sativa]
MSTSATALEQVQRSGERGLVFDVFQFLLYIGKKKVSVRKAISSPQIYKGLETKGGGEGEVELELDGGDGEELGFYGGELGNGHTMAIVSLPNFSLVSCFFFSSGCMSNQRPLKRALVLNDDDDEEDKLYKLKVLLPNSTSVTLALTNPRPEMSFKYFVNLVKEEYEKTLKRGKLLIGIRLLNLISKMKMIHSRIDIKW